MVCLLGGTGSRDQGKVQAKNRVDCNRARDQDREWEIKRAGEGEVRGSVQSRCVLQAANLDEEEGLGVHVSKSRRSLDLHSSAATLSSLLYSATLRSACSRASALRLDRVLL